MFSISLFGASQQIPCSVMSLTHKITLIRLLRTTCVSLYEADNFRSSICQAKPQTTSITIHRHSPGVCFIHDNPAVTISVSSERALICVNQYSVPYKFLNYLFTVCPRVINYCQILQLMLDFTLHKYASQ